MRISILIVIIESFIFGMIFNISVFIVEDKRLALVICSICSYMLGAINEAIRKRNWE